jgi:hypothetical protein
MSRHSAPQPTDTPQRSEDFEWPPKAEALSVYDIGPDPWHWPPEASNDSRDEHHGDRVARPAVDLARPDEDRHLVGPGVR